MIPTLLNDKSRLQEIYDLRVTAWENSDRSSSINKAKFPNGWAETIDIDAYHFVVFNDEDKIIAAARISLHDSIEELPYPGAFKGFNLPVNKPFAFYSRLVVSPGYRSSFSFKKLDHARSIFLKEHKIPFAIATCKDRRLKSLQEIGFEVLGKATVDYEGAYEEENAVIYIAKNINSYKDGQ